MEQKKRRGIIKISLPIFIIGIYIVAVFLFDDSPKLFLFANVLFAIMAFESLYRGWEISFKVSVPGQILLLYSGWVTISIIWAWDRNATLNDIKRQIIFTVLWMAIVNVLKQDKKFIEKGCKFLCILPLRYLFLNYLYKSALISSILFPVFSQFVLYTSS